MSRRLERELRPANWHQSKSKPDNLSAPLIVDPTSGTLTRKLKEICGKFKNANGIRVTVRERAGKSVRSD